MFIFCSNSTWDTCKYHSAVADCQTPSGPSVRATAEAEAKDDLDEERAAEKRTEYRKASAIGIPEKVTDRMLKRIGIFCGVPLLLGFSTGPIFYGLKVVAHVDVAPW